MILSLYLTKHQFKRIEEWRKTNVNYSGMALFDIFLFDVLLASVHLYSDISLAYTYFDTDNPWWAGVTLFAIALPGILGTIKRNTGHFLKVDVFPS